ncbi:hypothetical protein pv_9 [Pithovirus sibericum]|uniref:Uncharacterized protein n=1 Tax=Pithovirus sibericum TaxID=1450746 RepID=W5S4C8_9VIRU|nr:hypothetical protein pv_9 [Pithovirus sibericum]AHH01576.1 hypothetical protein pv_9 [Pithovirus sibericum]
MSRPVLLIVTASDCGGCRGFKDHVLSDLLNRLKSDNLVNVVQDELPTFRSSNINAVDPDIPAEVSNYIAWFPTLLLFPSTSLKDEPVILNGFVSGGKAQMTPRTSPNIVPISSTEINNWVRKTLENDPRFRSRKALLPPGTDLSSSSGVRYIITQGGKPIAQPKPYYTNFERKKFERKTFQ